MSQMNWQEILGWGAQELQDLRFVAYSYIKQGGYDVALTIFDALGVLAPPTAYDLQTLGALYLQVGNGLKALDFLDRALKLDPTHLPTQINRAKALFMLGYKRQGLIQAMELEKKEDKEIATQAAALILAYK
ncbi:MAG: type III secretion chaperone [Verrucomicrobiota bacterium]|nr:type III secretion chaperone [Verrucomicrobiota bacterium]